MFKEENVNKKLCFGIIWKQCYFMLLCSVFFNWIMLEINSNLRTWISISLILPFKSGVIVVGLCICIFGWLNLIYAIKKIYNLNSTPGVFFLKDNFISHFYYWSGFEFLIEIFVARLLQFKFKFHIIKKYKNTSLEYLHVITSIHIKEE